MIFVNVESNLASDIGESTSSYVNYLPPSSLQSAVFISTDPIEIFNTIYGLGKCCGIDNYPLSLLNFYKYHFSSF